MKKTMEKNQTVIFSGFELNERNEWERKDAAKNERMRN